MTREEFFNTVARDYYSDKKVTLKDLTSMLGGVMPAFGQLVTNIEKVVEGNTISFTDIDTADFVVAPKGYKPSSEDLDMSNLILKIHTKEDGTITIIEHGLKMFTPANKDVVLFLGGLINKQILFE